MSKSSALRIAFATFMALSATGDPASAQQMILYFDVYNNTIAAISGAQIKPSGSPNWGGNALGGNVIFSGNAYRVTIPAYGSFCHYDLVFHFRVGPGINDRERTFLNDLNLCSLAGMAVFRHGPNQYNIRWQNGP